MDTSCIDDQTTTSETVSTIAPPLTTKLPMEMSLHRLGSGASVVLDPERGVEVEAQSRKLPSSRYKGVVPQPNGRWGAQIYEKHQRVWLGTFNEEDEAAKAYDIAVQRFRGRDAVTNIKKIVADNDNDNDNDKEAAMEASFLNRHSKSEIVDMLRKHTYNDELEQSKRSCSLHQTIPRAGLTNSSGLGSVNPRVHLFQKTVTPSDVGKLNRLVIPKQHAEKHFPIQKGISTSKGVLLHFEDNGSKVWRFRYSYWNSSQSYVLTKGWSRFVKEKKLKAGDSVSFQSSTGPDKQLYIDCKSKIGSGNTNLHSIQPVKFVKPIQMLRLFGVDISSVNSYKGKRSNTERDLLGFQDSKKQRIINVL